MPVLRIGKYQPRFPLIQGGMGVDISGPNLAGNVAKFGAIGTIASGGICHKSQIFSPEKHNYFEANEVVLKEAIAQAKQIAGPEGIIAVNCMVALTDYDRQVRAAAEGGAHVIISGAGLPLRLPDYTKDFPDVALVPIVSSAKAASLITRHWQKKYNRSTRATYSEFLRWELRAFRWVRDLRVRLKEMLRTGSSRRTLTRKKRM